MKKTISILAILLFSMTFAFAQTATTKTGDASSAAPAAVNNPNAAEITFQKTVHDYGTIFMGGDGNSEFEFTNTGKEPLILKNVKSSCGCTVPAWPKEPIMPGKKETIKVKYDTGRVGPINKTITVTSNAKNDPIVLKITGNIIKKAEENTTPEKNLNSGAAPTAK